MRAKEFITEASRSGTRSDAAHEFERAHPGIVSPGGNGDLYWGRYYDFYRVAQLTGMDPDDLDKMDLISFFGNLPVFSGYSEHDRDKLFRVMKKLGLKPKDGISNGSTETDGTNTTSPMNGFKGFE
jgi:hypothetical protein